jgi:hypothetical protein
VPAIDPDELVHALPGSIELLAGEALHALQKDVDQLMDRVIEMMAVGAPLGAQEIVSHDQFLPGNTGIADAWDMSFLRPSGQQMVGR